jgi:hypothetical protein
MASVTVDYLVPFLRLKIGDTNPASYRYLDSWLIISLDLAIKNLQRFWNFKYLIDSSNNVTRNPSRINIRSLSPFLFDESYGVIQPSDEYVIVLMAAILVIEGSLENSAWDAVSWRDNEVSFTNSFNTNTRNTNLDRMITELNSLIKSPSKRLAWPTKGDLPGYIGNDYEREVDV